MRIGRRRSWAALLVLGCTAGCAGNGEGLDQNGQPISGGGTASGPITADFQSIQAHVFTPICSKCHIGASAPEGLQLDAAHSYNLLVGVPSSEQPALLRVKAGDPDDSYLVHKIEGQAGIDGGQMPLGESPLPQATIDAIRQWIEGGAPNAAATVALAGAATAAAATAGAATAGAAAGEVFAVQTTAPLDGAVVKAPLTRIIVTFNRDVDASLVNDSTVTLERVDAGTSTSTSTGTATATGTGTGTQVVRRVAAAGALAAENPAALLIVPQAPLDAGVYRVTVRGTGGGALADMNASILGVDAVFEFTLESR